MGRLRVSTRHLPLLLPKLYLPWERPRPQQGTPNVQVHPAAWSMSLLLPLELSPISSPSTLRPSLWDGQHPLQHCSGAKLGPFPYVPGGGAGCELGSVHTDNLRVVGCTPLHVALSFSLPHLLWAFPLKILFSWLLLCVHTYAQQG